MAETRKVHSGNDSITDILLVEDSVLQATVFEDVLQRAETAHFVIKRASNLVEAAQAIALHRFDVILLDLNLPDSLGIDTFHAIKRIAKDIPIVILTRTEDEHLAIEAVRAGAQDCLIKREVDPNVLGRVVQCAVERDRFHKAQGGTPAPTRRQEIPDKMPPDHKHHRTHTKPN